MARRKSFINKGTQFGPENTPSVQEMDNAVFSPPASTEDDPILKPLEGKTFRRAIQASGGKIVRGNFILTMTGLSYTGDQPTVEEWREMGEWLNKLRDSIQWMIGDWANLGTVYMDDWLDPKELSLLESQNKNDIPEGKYRWLASLVDYSYGTLRNFAYIARTFPVSRRRDTLSYSHHVEVAALPNTKQQDQLLDLADEGRNGKSLSVRELREEVQRMQGKLLNSGDASKTSPLIVNLVRIKQELTEERWQSLSSEERRRAYNDLKSALERMESLGVD